MAKKLSIPLPDGLKKNGFWIGVGVLALVMTIFWWLGTSQVATQRDESIKTIAGYVGVAGGIAPRANPDVIKELDKRIASANKSFMDTWKQVYDRQQKELVWPERKLDANGRVVTPGLSQEFIDAVVKLPAPERLVAKKDELRDDLKEQYRNFAKSQIEGLCDIVGASYRLAEQKGPKRETAPTSSAAAEKEETIEPGKIVSWPAASQGDAAELLTFPEGANPTTQKILYSQEDLWIYQTLFKIIRRTNDSIKEGGKVKDVAHYNAPVKAIQEVLIGKTFPADTLPGKGITLPGGKTSGSETTSTKAAAPAETEEGVEVEKPSPILLPAGERYVDWLGKRLKTADLLKLGKKAVDDGNADPFKRMPVQMKVQIDQRYLNRLLLECANSPLTVEVKHVTFQTMGHFERLESTKAGPEATGPKADKGDSKSFYDIDVTISGFVYMFYEPTKQVAPTEEKPADDAGTAEAPAAAGG